MSEYVKNIYGEKEWEFLIPLKHVATASGYY